MSMGGSKSKQSSTQTSEPPKWAKPLFTKSASDALNLYNSGEGGNVYQGQRVADLSGTTTGAINRLTGAADMYNSDAVNKLATGDTSSAQNLAEMASGSLIGNNPYFENALQGQLDKSAAQTMSQFSGAGRYGSSANTNALATSLGNIRSNALSNQYNQDVQNMLTANNQIDSANQNQLNSLNNLYQGYSGALGNALAGGQILDQNAQNKLNADFDKWTETDNRGWTRLGLLQSAAAGAAGNYGTQTGSQKSSGFSLGTKSDVRAKENIIPIGVRNGHTVYEWNYKGSSARYRGVMAQDVLEKDPLAVMIDEDGLFMVDYGRIGFAMEAA